MGRQLSPSRGEAQRPRWRLRIARDERPRRQSRQALQQSRDLPDHLHDPPGRNAPEADRQINRLTASVGAEWVRAPTEIESTPVSAISLTVARVTPPEASRQGRSPPPASASRSATASRRVAAAML